MAVLTNRQVLFILSGIHLLYFIAACYFKGILLVDSYGYLMQADNMSTIGNWYAEDWNASLLVDYFSIRPPLYAGCLLIFRFFTTNLFVVLVAQNILSVFNCWLVYRFVSRQNIVTAKLQYLFLMGIILYPAQMIHANFVMTEIVLQTIVLLLFFQLKQFNEQPNWKSSLGIGILLSVGLLTKPVALFLPIIAFIGMFWRLFQLKTSYVYLWVFGIVLVTYGGICLQNQHATGSFHYSSIKSINQLKYNARYALIQAKGEVYADSVITDVMIKANQKMDYAERLAYMNQQAFLIIKQYPVAFAKVYTTGVIAFFLDPGRFDCYHFFAIEEQGTIGLMHEVRTKGVGAVTGFLKQAPWLLLLLLLLNFCWNVFVLVSFIWFIVSKGILPNVRKLLIIWVLYIAAVTGPVGVSRYRVPVYPLLLIATVSLWAQPKRVVKQVERL